MGYLGVMLSFSCSCVRFALKQILLSMAHICLQNCCIPGMCEIHSNGLEGMVMVVFSLTDCFTVDHSAMDL